MGFQQVPKTASVQLVYGYAGGPDIINLFHVRDTTLAWNEARLNALAATVQAWWETNVKPLMVDDMTLRSIKMVDLDSEFGQRTEVTVGIAGTDVTTPAPAVVAALVKWQGDAGAPPRHTITFHPGLAEAQIGSGDLDATFASDLSDAYNALGPAVFAAVGTQAVVIVSRNSGSSLVAGPRGQTIRKPTPRATALTNTLASVSVSTRYGVQRRRRPSPL